MRRLFNQRLVLLIVLISFLGLITTMAIGTPYHNPFLTADNHLIAELELRDEQAGFVGVSGITWSILPDGTCEASPFVNNTVSSSSQAGQLAQADLVKLASTLLDQNFSGLPAEISSEPSLNPHRLQISLGDKSTALVLPAGQSIDQALTLQQQRSEAPAARFLKIAQTINQIVQQRCSSH